LREAVVGIVVVVVAVAVAGVMMLPFLHLVLPHEALTFPMAVVCDRAQQSVEVQMESTRAHGRIEQSEFAGCIFYWHEANTGGD